MALEIKLTITCFSLISSVKIFICSSCSFSTKCNSSSLSFGMVTSNVSYSSLMQTFKSIPLKLGVICLASILDISIKSSIIETKLIPQFFIIFRYSCFDLSLRFGSFKRSLKPIIAFIGVRISCDKLAKKEDLSLSLSSAFSLEISNCFLCSLFSSNKWPIYPNSPGSFCKSAMEVSFPVSKIVVIIFKGL